MFSLSSLRHTTPEKFFIEACDDGAEAVLAIDRVSNEMTLTGRKCDRTQLGISEMHTTVEVMETPQIKTWQKSQHFITCKLQMSLYQTIHAISTQLEYAQKPVIAIWM